jgi:hypothetical protein
MGMYEVRERFESLTNEKIDITGIQGKRSG